MGGAGDLVPLLVGWQMLMFATGSDRAPVEGLQGLNLVISRMGRCIRPCVRLIGKKKKKKKSLIHLVHRSFVVVPFLLSGIGRPPNHRPDRTVPHSSVCAYAIHSVIPQRRQRAAAAAAAAVVGCMR